MLQTCSAWSPSLSCGWARRRCPSSYAYDMPPPPTAFPVMRVAAASGRPPPPRLRPRFQPHFLRLSQTSGKTVLQQPFPLTHGHLSQATSTQFTIKPTEACLPDKGEYCVLTDAGKPVSTPASSSWVSCSGVIILINVAAFIYEVLKCFAH